MDEAQGLLVRSEDGRSFFIPEAVLVDHELGAEDAARVAEHFDGEVEGFVALTLLTSYYVTYPGFNSLSWATVPRPIGPRGGSY